MTGPDPTLVRILDAWLRNPDPEARSSYLRLGALRAALLDRRSFNAVVDQLGMPIRVAPQARSPAENLAAVLAFADELGRARGEFSAVRGPDVLVAALWRATLAGPLASDGLFFALPRRAELTARVAGWLRAFAGARVAASVPVARSQLDLLASLPDGAGRTQLVAVGIAAEPGAVAGALAQLATADRHVNRQYLAVTPTTALGVVQAAYRASRPPAWNPLVLDESLRRGGIGLLLVEQAQVVEGLATGKKVPDPTLHQALRSLVDQLIRG